MIPPHEIHAAVASGGPGWTPFRGRTLPVAGLALGVVILAVALGDVAGMRRDTGAAGGWLAVLFSAGVIAASVSALRAGRSSRYGQQITVQEQAGQTVTVIPQRARWGAAVFALIFGGLLIAFGVADSLAGDEWQPVPIVLGLPLAAGGLAALLNPRRRRPEPILLGERGIGVVLDDERRWFPWHRISGAEAWHQRIEFRGSTGAANFILIRDADAVPLLGLPLGTLGADHEDVVRLLAEHWERHRRDTSGTEGPGQEDAGQDESGGDDPDPDGTGGTVPDEPSPSGPASAAEPPAVPGSPARAGSGRAPWSWRRHLLRRIGLPVVLLIVFVLLQRLFP